MTARLPRRLASTGTPGCQSAFTLTELVVVIVILGVLSAVAIPRFIDTAGEARLSRMSYLFSSFQSGTQLAHSFWTARGQPPSGFMTVRGQPVRIDNGWPSTAGALSMLNAGNPPPFVPLISSEELEVRESVERPRCRFLYRPPRAPGGAPEYVNEINRANCAG